jgi:predicted Zn-dependent peptidase
MASGARLVFRPSRAAPRSVTLYAFAPGGFAAVPDGLAGAALEAAAMGGGEDGHDAAVRPVLREREALLWGTASTGALVPLFEQVRRALEAPDAPDPARLSIQEGLDAALAGLPFGRRAADPGDARAVYDRLFGDPRRFTFVLVGDTTPEVVERAAARVLPRLRPPRQALLDEADPPEASPRLPRMVERQALPASREAAAVAVAFRGRVEPDYDALAALAVLAALLEEALGDGVRASAELFFDAGVGEVRVVAEGEDVAPDDFEEDLLDAVRRLRARAPEADDLADARARLRTAHRADLEAAGGWLTWLGRLYRYDHDTREALEYGWHLGGVTADEVRDLAGAVLDPERYVVVVRPGS